MNIIIQKFGGTSVATETGRDVVVEKICDAITKGYSPVVVVSAMGRKDDPYATDTLLGLVNKEFIENNKLAQDLLMCCGEIISSVVLCKELYKKGIEAVPLTGGQAGIYTDRKFTEAQLENINTSRILSILQMGKIPVVAGFQGMTSDGYFTTLGRGGSDTTACILGVALKAEEIDIYTDVDGIMTADPRVVKDASLIKEITYNEVFHLADQGARVIDPIAIDMAKRGNVPVVIKNTMTDCTGTLIKNTITKDYHRIITGITHLSNRIQIIIRESDNKNNNVYRKLLGILAKNKISLDLINIFPAHQMFTINNYEFDIVKAILDEAELVYSYKKDCATVAIVGAGMKGVPGIAARAVGVLASNNIEILQTADSNMTIWCLINSENLEKAINLLHKEFELSSIH